VLIGAGPWLHVPVGKLHNDRCLPLHPHLVALIAEYRTAHVLLDNPLLLPRENGRPLDRHTTTRLINKAASAANLPHIHPHQPRHTLATQAINRGMTLQAIAALLGHRSLDMTLRYAKIANRTVADEYFAVSEKVEALTDKAIRCPPTLSGLGWHAYAGSTTVSSVTATAPDRPNSTAPSKPSARPARSSRPASSSDPPCNANATTPPTTTSPTAPTCSTASRSPVSTCWTTTWSDPAVAAPWHTADGASPERLGGLCIAYRITTGCRGGGHVQSELHRCTSTSP
jgi:hypothetical protein